MSKITVTKVAQDYFKKIINKQGIDGLAIRLTATNVGTPGVECGILYCPKEYITTQDEHFKMDGFEIVIDKNVTTVLDESVINLTTDENGNETLTFHAPNLKKKALPDDAPLKEHLKLFIENTVAPTLAGHNGYVELVDVTDDGVVQLKFSGGCNGCSLVGVTLKEGIMTQLNQAFPNMIKDVVDVTEHVKTEESFS